MKSDDKNTSNKIIREKDDSLNENFGVSGASGKMYSAKTRISNFTRTGSKMKKLNLQDTESGFSAERQTENF